MFKNKHVLVAMIVAPLLAIGTYFVTDFIVGEKPHKARSGDSYELIAQSNCRYSSGRCILKNGNFGISLRSEYITDGMINLFLESSHHLNGATIALVNSNNNQDSEGEKQPQEMTVVEGDTLRWTTSLKLPQSKDSRIRLVVMADEAYYYADTATAFIKYETSFQKDFRE